MNYPKSDRKKILETNCSTKSFKPTHIVSGTANCNSYILDFGCGHGQVSVAHLKTLGFKRVYAHDFTVSDNPPRGKFDYVIVQNVLNTIPSDFTLYLTLLDIAGYIKDDGICVMDFPNHYRAIKAGNLTMKGMVSEVFKEVFTLTSDKKNHIPVWACRLAKDINEEM